MVYKPTGRPPGRPKTKEYVTLMARVDGVLADQVKRYAALHRQPLSVVIRDALTLLMEEYPPGAPLSGPHPLTEHEFPSDRYESPLDTLVGETDSAGLAELLSDTNNFANELPRSKLRGIKTQNQNPKPTTLKTAPSGCLDDAASYTSLRCLVA